MIVSFTWMASRLGSRWGRDVGANHVAVLGRAPQDCAESDLHGVALRFLAALGTIRTPMRRAPRTFELPLSAISGRMWRTKSVRSPKPVAR